jgi:hypothetical protein
VSAVRRRRASSGAGVRHGVVLVLCVVVPVVHAAGSAAALRIEGFPVWGLVLLVSAVAVGLGILGAIAPRPGVTGVLSRLVGAATLALAVRMLVPSPTRALAEIRAGEAYLVSGTVLIVFVMLLFGAAVGHLVIGGVDAVAEGRASTDAAREDDRVLLVNAWGTALLMIVVAGFTHRSAGPIGQLLFVVAFVVALLALADLRSRIPAPGAARAPIVAVSRRVRVVAFVLPTMLVVAGVAVTVPLVPAALQEGVGRPSEWVEELELDWEPRRRPGIGAEGELDALLERGPMEFWELPELPELREIAVPVWLQALLLVLFVGALALVLRPDRWLRTFRRLWAALGGRDRDDAGDPFDELPPLDDAEVGPGTAGARLRGALERVRPRPRDPRQAIVHDYLRVERSLARDEGARRPSETPLEHAYRLHAAEGTGEFALLVELAGLVSTARYAASPPAPEVADRSRELQRSLDRSLRGRP